MLPYKGKGRQGLGEAVTMGKHTATVSYVELIKRALINYRCGHMGFGLLVKSILTGR